MADKMIVVVFGLPGSGKSYFAQRLAKKLKAVYISSDAVRKREFGQEDYSLRAKRAVYKRMVEIGKEARNRKRKVIFDGTFYLENIRKMITESFKSDTEIYFIEVHAPEELIKERTGRKRADSDADFEVYKKIKRSFQQMKTPHLKLASSDENLEDNIQKAIAHLNTSES
ncbi:MAG: ATP-binding protein [Cyclobacteriaceae bacterium]